MRLRPIVTSSAGNTQANCFWSRDELALLGQKAVWARASGHNDRMHLQPKALDHIGLKVTDIQAAVRFYHDILGMELVRAPKDNPHGGSSAVVRAGGQSFDLFYRPDFVSADKDKPVGMDHVCLVVEAPSVDELIQYLKDAGVEVFWAPVERDNGTSVYVYDPDGIHVELRLPKEASG
jgi:catechol 2,3-dioxygenase-like lactoylglutathione lyase family enzyme